MFYLILLIGGIIGVWVAYLLQVWFRRQVNDYIRRSWNLDEAMAEDFLAAFKVAINHYLGELTAAVKSRDSTRTTELVKLIQSMENRRRKLFVLGDTIQNNPWFRAGRHYKPLADMHHLLATIEPDPELVLNNYSVYPGEDGITVSGTLNDDLDLKLKNVTDMSKGCVTADGRTYRLGTPVVRPTSNRTITKNRKTGE